MCDHIDNSACWHCIHSDPKQVLRSAGITEIATRCSNASTNLILTKTNCNTKNAINLSHLLINIIESYHYYPNHPQPQPHYPIPSVPKVVPSFPLSVPLPPSY